jgi:hypothetical protein
LLRVHLRAKSSSACKPDIAADSDQTTAEDIPESRDVAVPDFIAARRRGVMEDRLLARAQAPCVDAVLPAVVSSVRAPNITQSVKAPVNFRSTANIFC